MQLVGPPRTHHLPAPPSPTAQPPAAGLQITMSSIQRILPSLYALGIGLLFATPAPALVLLSETRSVTASYYGGGIETITSDGSFSAFTAVAVGVPFGGGAVRASQVSHIATTGFDLQHSLYDGYGPGGWAASTFELRFSLEEDTRISIIGYSAYFSGPASLVSETQGAIPLVWGPPGSPFRNHLEFEQVLKAGVYTFTSNETLRGDGISTRLALREVVPDGGSSIWYLVFAFLSLVALRRRAA